MSGVTVRPREVCRVCGGRQLRRFLDFPRLPFADGFVAPGEEGSEFTAPLAVYWCADCATAQTAHDLDVGEYYDGYHYTVSASPLVQNFMRRLAEEAAGRYGLRAGDRALDIGASDGWQLRCFQDLGLKGLGFEPSRTLCAEAERIGVTCLPRLFTAASVAEIPPEMRPAQVVVTLHTLDHLPDPLGFLQAIRSVLDPARGVLLIEVHDLEKIFERREVCLFAHDHTIYLTARSLGRLLERAGFKLLTEELLPERERRGNSLTVAAAPAQAGFAVEPVNKRPWLTALDEWETYANFAAEVRASYGRLRDYVRSRRAEGRRLGGYSAGGRTVLTLAGAELNREDFVYLLDRNPHLHGRLTAGSHVPVFRPEHVFTEPVDELIVFSYGYMEEIKTQLAPYLAQGGKLTSFLDLL